jgi:Asp/Glu/hydantoin racemase
MPKRVLVIVPFPLDDEGVANRRLQASAIDLGPDIQFDFEPVKAGAALLDSFHDSMLADLALYEVGMSAQERGYDAVCSDTMSDSGVNALRSLLDIPVIGPGRASYLTALMLGQRFSVLTQWDGWIPIYQKGVHDAGLDAHCASIRSINMRPDLKNLLGGKEEVVFPLLLAEAQRCIEDGADGQCARRDQHFGAADRRRWRRGAHGSRLRCRGPGDERASEECRNAGHEQRAHQQNDLATIHVSSGLSGRRWLIRR